MTPSLHVATTDDLAPLGALLAHAFGFPPEDAAAWFERAGSENVLAYREEAGVAGGLLLVPMGQFFGGRSVPMMGVAGVGIAPERRGSGAGGEWTYNPRPCGEDVMHIVQAIGAN